MKEYLILEQLVLIEESGNYTHHCTPIIFPDMADLSYRDDYEYPSCSHERLRNLFFLSLSLEKNNLSGREKILVSRGNWHLEKEKKCSVYNPLEGPV